MTDQDMQIFDASLGRCLDGPDFVGRFYKLLLSSSPEMEKFFEKTDFDVQKRKLKDSLYMAMLLADESAEGHAHFERMGELHGRTGLGIRPELYEQWLECLLAAVREYDPEYDDTIDELWRRMMRPALEFLKSRY